MKNWLRPRFFFWKSRQDFYGESGSWKMWSFLCLTLTIYDNWVFFGDFRDGWQVGWISPFIKPGSCIPVLFGRVKVDR